MEAYMKVQPKKIKLSDYDIQQTLGMGAYATVKLAKNKSSGKFCTVKIFKKEEIMRLKQTEHIHNELKILSFLDHSFIVKTDGFAQDERYLYIVMELVNGGELFTELRKAMKFKIEQATLYTAQIITILEYLHYKMIIYRDLKPENLLLDRQGYLKLADFGLAKLTEGKTYTLCGTPDYMAPEMILGNGYGKSVDWWSLGILLYEMLAGFTPFSDPSPVKVYQNILREKVRFPKSFDANARSLVKHLLDKDITQRAGCTKGGVDEMKRHRLFQNIEWSLVSSAKIKASYIPKTSSNGDVENFTKIADPDLTTQPINNLEDPFEKW